MLQKGPVDYILVFLVLALIILVPGVFSSQRRFFQENMQSASSGPAESYVWLTDAPGLHDGLYLFTPDQLESRLPGTGPLVSQEATNGAGSLVYAIQFDASSPREVGLPPPVANIFFQPIPINRADKSILTSLPGVGPVLAERILQRREERGPSGQRTNFCRLPESARRNLPHWSIISLWNECTKAQRHRGTEGQRHRGTEGQRDKGTE